MRSRRLASIVLALVIMASAFVAGHQQTALAASSGGGQTAEPCGFPCH